VLALVNGHWWVAFLELGDARDNIVVPGWTAASPKMVSV